MAPWLKKVLRLLAIIVGTVVIVFGGFVGLVWLKSSPSKLTDFTPTTFEATTEEPFFYSIDSAMKYSTSIDPSARTIIAGDIRHVVVAPDGRSALAVIGDTLFLVTPDSARRLTGVGSIYRTPKPIGVKFTRDRDMQWSRDGTKIYVIRDEYYDTPSQLFSRKGELWMADVATDSLTRVLAPFLASDYALGANGSVYYVEPEQGDLILKRFDGDSVTVLGPYQIRGPYPETVTDTPFVSFPFDQADNQVAAANVRLDQIDRGGFALFVNDRSVLTSTRAKGIYGGQSCLSLMHAAFLPGDRFLFIDPRCATLDGGLLIEASSGRYMKIPGTVRVYPVSNSLRYPPAKPPG